MEISQYRGAKALYNVVADKGESRNLAVANPSVVAELRTALASYKADLAQ